MFQQHPAHQRAKRRAAGAHGRPQPQRHITVTRLREGGADPGKRCRDNHRRADGQQRAGSDQRQRGRRKRRRQRCQAEDPATQQQQALKANLVAERAHRQHHSGHHQWIDINDPQQLIAAGAQLDAQRRRGHVQHGGINRHRDIDHQNSHER